jgi:hypothetical protein
MCFVSHCALGFVTVMSSCRPFGALLLPVFRYVCLHASGRPCQTCLGLRLQLRTDVLRVGCACSCGRKHRTDHLVVVLQIALLARACTLVAWLACALFHYRARVG